MKARTTIAVMMLLALPLHALAQGQQIWRCGDDGRSYSTTPCADGRLLEPVAAPSAARQAEAHRIALADERLAARMRADRLRSEAAARRNALAGFQTTLPGPDVKAGSAQATKRRHPAAAGTWRAAGPSSRRAKG